MGGYTSEVDDPGFFQSPEGKIDPQAELHATLAKFFSAEVVGRSKQAAQCAFIARFQWLRVHLQFDETRLPFHKCERYENLVTELNPVSMFGHSFLRIDQQGQTEHTRILAYTINYATDVPPDTGVEFAFKGMFGGYQGFPPPFPSIYRLNLFNSSG